MARIDFEKDTVGHFISDNFLRVPLYQRSFAWEVSHVEDLFNDITNSYPEDYFIGTIVVTDKGDYLEIVDGQQRLATISLFYIAVRDFLKGINNEKAKYIENEYILKEALRDEDKKQKLELNSVDNHFYQKRFIENNQKEEKHRDSHNRLLSVYKFISDFIKNIYDRDQVNGIFNYVEFFHKNLQVIIVKVSDDVNAFTIFETLNDRGLVLSQTDLIKNHLFHKSGDSLQQAQDKWSRFTGSIELAECEEEILQYVRYYWSSQNGLIREKDLFKDIKNKITNKNQAITLLENLERNAELYLALLNPNHQFWKEYPYECAVYIGELKELGLTQNRPLLLAVLGRFSDRDEVKKALKLINSWSVRNLITGIASGGTLEKEFSNLAKLINDGKIKDVSELLSSMQHLIPTDEQFKKAFEIATVSKANLARYYLRKLEESYRPTREVSPSQIPERVNLEHILPENPANLKNDWPLFDENIHRTYYRRLGNLTLLDTKMNSDIRDGSFEAKKGVYNQSELLITKNLTSFNNWGPEEIEKRQSEFAEKAVNIWRIKI